MLENLTKYQIILGSASPRRKELLAGLGLDFEVRPVAGLDESYPSACQGEEIPVHITQNKARAYQKELKDTDLLITADTIVWIEGKVLGKPADKEEAITMLKQLSGKKHQVITGVCITTKNKQKVFSVTSEVQFSELTHDEIIWYVDTFAPYDKAGSYGIQEWIGYIGVESIRGSFYNVMGLPIQRLYQELKNF